jgi:hypothetical protein
MIKINQKKKLQKKRLSHSQQEVLIEILDIDSIKQALFHVYNITSNNYYTDFNNFVKKIAHLSNFDEFKILKILIKKSFYSNKSNEDINKTIISLLLEEDAISPFDLFDLFNEEKTILKTFNDTLSIETFLKKMPVNQNTWLDLYFNILSNRNFGNPQAYKVINSWILLLFSAPIHKTQKQAYDFIFSVYFQFSLWKITDSLYLHEIFIIQSGLLKVNDHNSLTLSLKSFIDSDIPLKAILNAARLQPFAPLLG